MRHDAVKATEESRFDWKGLGYIFSVCGVLLLGARSLPKHDDPWWFWPAVTVGSLVSIVGFGLRYWDHLKQQKELRKTKAKAEQH